MLSRKCHGKSRHYDYIKNWEELSNRARERRIKACDDMPVSFMGKHELITEMNLRLESSILVFPA